MVSGADLIFIFEALLIVTILFIVIHIVLNTPIQPYSLLFVMFGLLAINLTNQVELTLFNAYLPTPNNSIVLWAPLIEEVVKVFILIYFRMRPADKIRELLLAGYQLGLGFAVGELIGYAFLQGTGILLQRSILIVFGHPLYGFLIAYGFGKTYVENNTVNKFATAFIYVLGAIFLHMIWNYFAVNYGKYIVAPVFLSLGIWWWILKDLVSSSDQSNSS